MKSRLLVAAVGVPLTVFMLFFAPTLAFDVFVGVIAVWCGAELFIQGVKTRKWWALPLAIVIVPCIFSLVMWQIIVGEPGPQWMCVIPFGCAYISDAAAMLSGKYLGKRHIFSKISPNKTGAGAIGGIVGSAAFMLAFWLCVPAYSWASHHPIFCVVFGAIIGVVAECGDLLFSLIKRKLGIKDYGSILRGHGGVLDRFDSMVLVAPLSVVIWTLGGSVINDSLSNFATF